MTLSIAWRSEGRIHLASDSRISFGKNQYADVGIKVLAIPVQVSGTELGDDSKLIILHKSRCGFCYAGSLANAATLKELLEEVLRLLQFVEQPESLSFEHICNAVKLYCGHLTTEVCRYLAEKGRYEFFLAGYCPLKKMLQAAHFTFDHRAGNATASFKIILDDDNSYVAIGSCAVSADKLIKSVNNESILLALNTIIDRTEDESVGGDIQYGTFDKDANFLVHAIARISEESVPTHIAQDGTVIFRQYSYRGLQLNQEWFNRNTQFWLSPPIIELKVPSNTKSRDAFLKTQSVSPVPSIRIPDAPPEQ
jgi:hypothetical protein